jgi:hypothetical protein
LNHTFLDENAQNRDFCGGINSPGLRFTVTAFTMPLVPENQRFLHDAFGPNPQGAFGGNVLSASNFGMVVFFPVEWQGVAWLKTQKSQH